MNNKTRTATTGLTCIMEHTMATCSAAASMSPSRSTRLGAFPPSSSESTGVIFSTAVFSTSMPTLAQPQNTIPSISGEDINSFPASDPRPKITLKTSSGKPASVASFAITVHPAARHGAAPLRSMSTG